MGRFSCPCQEFYFPVLPNLSQIPPRNPLWSFLYLSSGHLSQSPILLFGPVILSGNFPSFFFFLFKKPSLGNLSSCLTLLGDVSLPPVNMGTLACTSLPSLHHVTVCLWFHHDDSRMGTLFVLPASTTVPGTQDALSQCWLNVLRISFPGGTHRRAGFGEKYKLWT